MPGLGLSFDSIMNALHGKISAADSGLQLRSFTQRRKSSMERKNVYTEYVSGCDVADELLTLVPHGGNLSSM